ncbi:MAG: PQQ-binding-like beta-propeller repeat protein, partial [Ignavibacteriales bacterium]|nr:PQQ-binding-like beta-propeller repeat protein [Ignavibacteriales bacterium]
GGLDSTLYALSEAGLKPVWKFKTKGEIRSNVCASGGNIYLNGGDGFLYALEAKSGKVIWKFMAKGEAKYDFADYFHSTPAVHNGVIFFGSGDTYFYAIKEKTGTLLWSYKTDGIIHTTPAIDSGKIFFGSFDGNVYALHEKTGKQIWKFKTVGHRYFPKGEVQGSPVCFGGVVIVGARDYNVYALDQEKGFCRWNKAYTKGWCLSNTIYDSTLFTGGADERVLISANPLTGKENWKREMEFLIFGNCAFDSSMLYVGTTIGKLHAMRTVSGKKLWAQATDAYTANKSKYFKANDSYRDDIYSIITSNEQFLDVEFELGGIFSTPLVLNGAIVFTSTDGTVTWLEGNGENNK